MIDIQQNISLREYNTFQIDAIASYFTTIESKEDFQELLQHPIFKNNKKLFLGGGSNMLLTQDFDGLVIKNNIKGMTIISENTENIEIKIGGGEVRDEFVLRSAQQGYSGVENLALIPGSVGASPIQNIGAYGVEAKDTIKSVSGIDITTGEYKTYQNNECEFGYRDSIFKKTLKDIFFITDVSFVLQKTIDKAGKKITYTAKTGYAGIEQEIEKRGIDKNSLTPLLVSEIISDIRRSKLPDRHVLGTAGSFFKNPIISRQELEAIHTIDQEISFWELDEKNVKLSAGQLIDKSGLKGHSIGQAGTYEKHALILVNLGNAKGSDIQHLAQHIQDTVFKKFGVHIEPEVNYIA